MRVAVLLMLLGVAGCMECKCPPEGGAKVSMLWPFVPSAKAFDDCELKCEGQNVGPQP